MLPPAGRGARGRRSRAGPRAMIPAWRGSPPCAPPARSASRLPTGRDAARLLAQAREFRPEVVSGAPEVADLVRPHLPPGTRLATGVEGAKEVATLEVDTVVAAITGMAGLKPTAAALAAGRHVALAN